MIYINCPMKSDFIIELLEASQTDGVSFKFIEKKGIKLAFEVNTEDLDKAIAIAKSTIKATEIGSVLFFQVLK